MPQVDIGIYTKVPNLQRTILNIHRTFEQAGRDAGQTFSRTLERNLRPIDPGALVRSGSFVAEGARAGREFSTGFNRAIDLRNPTVRVRESVRRDTHGMVRDAAAVGTAMGSMGTAAATAGNALAGSMTNAGRTASSALGSVTDSFGKASGAASTFFGTLKVGGIAVGVGMLADVAKAAVTASQSLWLLPAGIAAAGTGFAALKIGAQGFGEALENMRDPEEFAKALQSLSPAAQQAALSIQALLPQWDALKSAVQDALFNNVGQQISALAGQYLPTLQGVLSSVAGSLNSAFQGVSNTLLGNPQLISNVAQNIQSAFETAANAAAPFTDALLRITSVGSDFLPRLASGISEAANSFATFIADAAETGKLQQWIEDGLAAAKELGSVVWDIGKTIYDTFGSAKPGEFKQTLDTIVGAAGLVMDAINGIRNAWELFGNAAANGINTAISAVEALLNPLRTVANILNQLPGVNIDVGALPGISIPRAGAPVAGTPVAAPETAPANPFAPQGSGSRAGGGGLGGVFAVPAAPPAAGSRGGRSDGPVAPYTGDPMALLRGAPVTASTYSAAQSLAKAQADVAQSQAELDEAVKSGSASEIVKARNALAQAQQDQTGAQLRLAEALQSVTKGAQSATAAMSDISAALDPDLGISKGLAGLADNLVRFVGNLATAPLQAALNKVKAANPNEGSGLVGIAAAQGAFGARFTPQALAASNYGAPQSYPGSYGGYPGDTALLANVRPGRYSQAPDRDLLKGLSDCSSSIGDLVNILDGNSTGGQKLTTGNAAQWLPSHGFLPGAGRPGDFRVGFNSGHMQATLPGGTPWNWGSDAAAARGGIGGTGADDPAFTSHYYRPASMPGGPLANGMPQAFPGGLPGSPLAGAFPGAQPYAPTPQPQQQPGWQPSGGGGGGGILGAAMGAAGMGLDMLAPGSGAAAQIASQAIQRTIKYGGQVAGSLAQGALDFFSVSDPDGGGGTDLTQSWLGRAASSLASAAPALPATAGKQDKQPPQVDPNTTQHGQGNGQQPGPPTLHIENFNQSPDRQGVAQTANDLTYAAYASGMR